MSYEFSAANSAYNYCCFMRSTLQTFFHSDLLGDFFATLLFGCSYGFTLNSIGFRWMPCMSSFASIYPKWSKSMPHQKRPNRKFNSNKLSNSSNERVSAWKSFISLFVGFCFVLFCLVFFVKIFLEYFLNSWNPNHSILIWIVKMFIDATKFMRVHKPYAFYTSWPDVDF